MTPYGRDGAEIEALLTDLYLETLLAHDGTDLADARLDPAVRDASERLRRDLVRVHPSFRFEERLATRLAEAAAELRMPQAVGAEGTVIPLSARSGPWASFDPLADADPEVDHRELTRPLLIGGALTSAAISLAGAAFVAWRWVRPGRGGSAMVRAARAVREARLAAVQTGRLD